MTAQPGNADLSAASPVAVAPPTESWVAGRLFRIINAALGTLLLGAASLPLITGRHDVAGALIRINDARLIFTLLAVALVGVSLVGVVRLGTSWVRSASVVLGLLITLWALAVLLSIHEVGIPESLEGASPGFGLWLTLVLGVGVVAVATIDRGTLLVAAGHGQRARKISDQLYPRYCALGTEDTDPWFWQLRFELSRKGI